MALGMTERAIAIGGATLHTEDDGAGAALLLVNGAFCTVRQWDAVVPALVPSFRVVRHDVRGTGRSGPGAAADYRFERYAADLVSLCDELGVERAALWGMAWGARVALVAAAQHGDRFTRLVLSDLAIDPADPAAQREGAKAAAAARTAAGIAGAAPPEGWNVHDDPGETGKALAATRHHPDLMPFVSRVRLPTLIATGEHDPNLASSRRALAGFADARLEVLPHTGHGSVLQRPDVVLDTVLPFLAE